MNISVIIPAFDSVGYLPGCLDSALAPGVEIILVDDGSSDGTGEMVRNRFPAVKVFSQPNQGVSIARNVGISQAAGTYLVFLDADDRLSPGALSDLERVLAGKNPDIIIMRSFSSRGEHYPWKDRFVPGQVYGKEDIVRAGYVRGSVCGCAFRREYVMTNGLRFPEGITMGEDLTFLSMALSAGGSVVFIDIPFYQIDQHEGSASRQVSPAFLSRYADGLVAASRLVADSALRSQACMSMMLGITRVGRKLSLGPRKTFIQGRFSEVLPLSRNGTKTGGFIILLMNHFFPLMYYLQGIKDRLFR